MFAGSGGSRLAGRLTGAKGRGLDRTPGGEGLGTRQMTNAGGGWSTAAQGCGCGSAGGGWSTAAEVGVWGWGSGGWLGKILGGGSLGTEQMTGPGGGRSKTPEGGGFGTGWLVGSGGGPNTAAQGCGQGWGGGGCLNGQAADGRRVGGCEEEVVGGEEIGGC